MAMKYNAKLDISMKVDNENVLAEATAAKYYACGRAINLQAVGGQGQVSSP